MKTSKLLQRVATAFGMCLMVFAFVGATSAFAQNTIYVSSTSGSDAFAGTQQNVANGNGPKRTINGANGAIAAINNNASVTTLVIEAGNYDENVNLSLAPANRSLTVILNQAGTDNAVDVRGGGAGTANFTIASGTNITIDPSSTAKFVIEADNDGANGETANLGSGIFTITAGSVELNAGAVVDIMNTNVTGSTFTYLGNATINYLSNTNATLAAGGEIAPSLGGGGLLTINHNRPVGTTTFGSPIATLAGFNQTNAGVATLNVMPTFADGGTGLQRTGAGNVTLSAGVMFMGCEMNALNNNNAAGTLGVSGTATFNCVSADDGNDVINNVGDMNLADVLVRANNEAVGNVNTSYSVDFNNTGDLDASGTVTTANGASTNGTGVLDADVDVDNFAAFDVAGTGSSDLESVTTTAPATSTSFAGPVGVEMGITNNSGNVSIGGAATVGGTVTNNGTGNATFTAGATIAGALVNNSTGDVTFGANSSVAGQVDNNGGDIELGAGVTLTASQAAPHTEFGDVNGATGTVALSGANATLNVSALTNFQGNLLISGNETDIPDGAGANLFVGGNFNITGPGTHDIGEVLDVGGSSTLGATTNFDAAGNDIDGALNVSAVLNINANSTVGSFVNNDPGNTTVAGGVTFTVEGDFDDDNFGDFTANAAGATVVMNEATTSMFMPGTNRVIDILTFMGNGTVTMTQSVSVQSALNVMGTTTVNLGQQLIRMINDPAAVMVNGSITAPTNQDGALAFENSNQTLGGLGSITNILVNNAGAAPTVTLVGGTQIDFTGTITLFDGGITLPANTDISPSGSSAQVRVNTAEADATINIAGGTFNNDNGMYMLTYYGGATRAPATGEFATTGVSTLKLEDANTRVDADLTATVGNVTLDPNTRLDIGTGNILTATGAVTVPNTAEVSDDAVIGTLRLTGASTHAVAGIISADLQLRGDGSTLNGSTTGSDAARLFNVMVGDGANTAAVTVSNIQEIDGMLTVNNAGTLSLGMYDNTTDPADARVDQAILINDGGTLTLLSSFLANNTVTVGTATGATVNFGVYDLRMISAAGVFTGDDNSTYTASTGALELDATVTFGTNGASIPNVQIDANSTLGSNTTVGTSLDANADVAGGGFTLSLAGDGTFSDNGGNNVFDMTNGTFASTGTTMTFEDPANFNNFTVNSTSTSTFQSDSSVDESVTINGTLTHTMGDVMLNNVDLTLTGAAFNWTAGMWMANDQGSEVVLNNAALVINTNNGTLTIPHVEMDNSATLTGSDTFVISENFDADNGTFTVPNPGTLQLGSGADLDINFNAGAAGIVVTAGGTLSFGATNTDYYYDGAGNTGIELAIDGAANNNTMVGELSIDAGNITIDADNRPDATSMTVSVNLLDLNAGLDIDGNDDGDTVINLNAMGEVQVAVDLVDGTRYQPQGDYTLTLNGNGVTPFNAYQRTTNDGGSQPIPTTLNVVANANLPGNRTTQDLTVGAATLSQGGSNLTVLGNATIANNGTQNLGGGTFTVNGNTTGGTLALAGGTVNVVGNLNLAGGNITTGPGNVNFNGMTVAQTLTAPTAGLTLPAAVNVTVNNSGNVTLAGGNLTLTGIDANGDGDFSDGGDTAGGVINFNDGLLMTGNNVLTIAHVSTNTQGFTQNADNDAVDGGVMGNVRKEITGGTTLTNNAPANRIEFPLAEMQLVNNTNTFVRREGAVTINDPNQVSSLGRSGIFLTMNHTTPATVAQMGNNGMPLQTQFLDPQTNQLEPLKIARYAPFFWNLRSSVTLSPSVGYDVEFRGDGFAAFAPEAIEKTRTISRQASQPTNFWSLVGPVPASNENFQDAIDEPVVRVRDAVGQILQSGQIFTIGLESNLTAADQTVAVNAGSSIPVDLTTVFTGGTGTLSYTITEADAGVATGSATGTTLTVSGVSAGTTTLTVVATGELNDSITATITVNVAAALNVANAIADKALNAGQTADDDLSVVFDGGTSPLNYAVTSSDTGVATVAVVNGVLTVTSVAQGTATITVTATDGTGASVTDTFDVTVNAALAAAAIPDGATREGADVTVDLATVVTGGDGNYTYTVTSSDGNQLTGSVTGSTLTASVPDAYEGGTTVGTETLTISVTDGLGSTASTAFTVDVLPALGDLNGVDGPLGTKTDADDTSILLRAFVGRTTITAKQTDAADFDRSANGAAFTPFDGALILRDAAGLGAPKDDDALIASRLVWGETAREADLMTVPVNIEGRLSGILSMSFSMPIAEGVTVESVTNTLADGWMFVHHVDEEAGLLHIAATGLSELAQPEAFTVTFRQNDAGAEMVLRAEAGVNANTVAALDELTVVELPGEFALQGNYPNPFNPTTTVQFDLPEAAEVSIQVIDMLGRRVMTTQTQEFQAGAKRSVQLDGSRLASGTYLYRVIAKAEGKTFVETGKMLLVK